MQIIREYQGAIATKWGFCRKVGIAAVLLSLASIQGFGQQRESNHAKLDPAISATEGQPESASAGPQRAGPDLLYPNAANPGWPNKDITPANVGTTICSKDWSTKSIRPDPKYTDDLKLKQMPDYGDTVHQSDSDLRSNAGAKRIDESLCKPNSDSPHCYEEDHIISLENGGDPMDPRNLWPEPYNTQVGGQRVGAHEKDAVENYVHNGICLNVPNAKFSMGPKPPHALTLKQGQDILAHDWYGCFLKMQKHEDCN